MNGQKLKQFIKLSESKLLDRYLKSRGISPENLTPIQKISYSKSSSFLNWVKLNGARQDVFREELDQEINEVLSKDASAGDWIHDFIHSDNPKFDGKSKEKRKEMALAAYYAKKRNEEVEEIPELQLSELTTNLLARYKKASGADASKADKAGNFERGNKRFRGIIKATIKQFDNDLKKHKKPVSEELYDSEKEDKSVATYGKKPKFKTVDPKENYGENKIQAAAVLTGGKTLTGATRDTIEIDPIMRRKLSNGSEKINKK